MRFRTHPSPLSPALKFAAAAFLSAGLFHATSYSQTTFTEAFSGINTAIPDGDLSGLTDSRTVTTALNQILDVNVTLNISSTGAGAVNGDLYAYLSHDSGIAILLNRPGLRSGSYLGYDDAGFNSVVFDDSASNGDVHVYRVTLEGSHTTPLSPAPSALSGNWAPDGRFISPASAGATFDATPRTALLSSFNGLNPNGTWILFLADAEAGGTARLDSWSLTITAVPEPGAMGWVVGLGLTGFLFVRGWRGARQRRARG